MKKKSKTNQKNKITKKLATIKKSTKSPKNISNPAKPKKLSTNKKVTEKEFLSALDNVTKKLVYKFRFGYHDVEDMKQQATIYALEGVKFYDHTRPLENFLWTHIHNRLFNFKRNNYKRPDSPCHTCPLHDPNLLKSQSGCEIHADKESCDLYRPWLDRNKNKQNLMTPAPLEHDIQTNKDLTDNVANNELLIFIESNITGDLRESYLRLKSGEKLSKHKLEKLQKHIESIMLEFKGNNNE